MPLLHINYVADIYLFYDLQIYRRGGGIKIPQMLANFRSNF